LFIFIPFPQFEEDQKSFSPKTSAIE